MKSWASRGGGEASRHKRPPPIILILCFIFHFWALHLIILTGCRRRLSLSTQKPPRACLPGRVKKRVTPAPKLPDARKNPFSDPKTQTRARPMHARTRDPNGSHSPDSGPARHLAGGQPPTQGAQVVPHLSPGWDAPTFLGNTSEPQTKCHRTHDQPF